jgi:predicted phosphodiesterase
MYAVISDIHGNLEALQAVMEDLPEGVERVFCLGDIIGYGASPNECTDLVREAEMPTISGNHDLAVTDLSTNLEWFNPVAAAAVLWTREVLSNENAQFLRERPRMMQTKGALFVHGSIRDPDEYIINRVSAQENLAILKSEYDGVPICFFGHTHVKAVSPAPLDASLEEDRALDLSDGGPYLLNPGSVGQPRDGDTFASYVLVEPAESANGIVPGPLVAYRFVEYDIAERLAAGR